MDELIKMLDKNLDYKKHEIIGDCFYITVSSNRFEVKCPHCNRESNKCHSVYRKTFQDLPIQGKKVLIILSNRIMFCDNPECTHLRFCESFDCLQKSSKRAKRLDEEITRLSLNVSTVTASRILSKNVAAVGRSTISMLLKKRKHSN